MSDQGAASLLIVDDEAAVRRTLRRFFENEGFDVEDVGDGEAFRNCAKRGGYDLFLLDINLGRENGLELLKQVRRDAETPVIFISGKDDVIDRIVGLELGADDYIIKPFELREVLARVRSVLRRTQPGASPASEKSDAPARSDEVICFGGWRFDRVRRTLTNPEGETVELTSGEHDLLTVFVDHPQRPLSRDQLLDYLKGAEWSPYDRSIDTQVRRLRKKIEQDPAHPALIKTVRGVGYVFTAVVARD